MCEDEDFTLHLPEEVWIRIFSLLDGHTLLVCPRVCWRWYKCLTDVHPQIWFKACWKAGIFVRNDKYKTVREWKAFFQKMLQRRMDMCAGYRENSPGSFFRVTRYNSDRRINAIYNYKGQIGIAFKNQIGIWTLGENRGELLEEFHCSFEPSLLKFDDNFFVAASRNGMIECWSRLTNDYEREYCERDGELTSFDFLTECEIVVGSYFPHRISLWSLSKDAVKLRVEDEKDDPIVKVTLAVDTDHLHKENKKRSFLFSLTARKVIVSVVQLLADTSCYYFSIQTLVCLNFHTFEPSFPTLSASDIFSKYHGELLFDGEDLYILPPHPPEKSFIIFMWNFKTGWCKYLQSSRDRIVSLLGVGKRYIAYEKWRTCNNECVLAVDKFTSELIVYCAVPRIPSEDNDQLCLVNTDWLDGLDGENDRGVFYALISEDKLNIYIIEFPPKNDI